SGGTTGVSAVSAGSTVTGTHNADRIVIYTDPASGQPMARVNKTTFGLSFSEPIRIDAGDGDDVVSIELSGTAATLPVTVSGGNTGVSAVSAGSTVTGTHNADRIVIYTDPASGQPMARVNKTTFGLSFSEPIRIDAGDGDDVVSIELSGTAATLPVTVYGGN